MIQDISPKTLDNLYRPEAVPDPYSAVICFHDGKILMRETEGNEISFPSFGDFPYRDKEFIYLFRIDEEMYFFCDCSEELALEGFSYREPNIFRSAVPADKAYALVTARHICSWYMKEKFCGECGAHMIHDKKERMMRCPECGNTVYPVVSPAVITGVVNGDRLLVTKYAGRPGARRAALIAGFNEVGETIEQTVKREVMEEAGLKVTDIRYYKSQPWGISGSLLFGFWCRVDGSDEVSLNDGELAEAVWMTRQEILDSYPEGSISLTSEMALLFAGGFDPYGETEREES